jgi:uncharacterized protein
VLRLRDPIHGFVHADALEAALVASRPVQRLRWIHQLGLTFFVYPGAEHSRFSHVLGVMGLAGRVFDSLMLKRPEILPAGERALARRLVRAAALLHDIGHAPFSHSAEDQFEGGIDHEQMTRLLLAGVEILDCFERHGARPAWASRRAACTRSKRSSWRATTCSPRSTSTSPARRWSTT